MNLIRIPLDDDDAIFVNPEHIVAVVPTEHEEFCQVVLVSDDEGFLVPMSAEKCVEHIMSETSGGDAHP